MNAYDNIYNIVWADDEIDILEQTEKDVFEASGLNIRWKAHNGKELEEVIKKNKYKIDAVIIDANFSDRDKNVTRERQTSGLHLSIKLFEALNKSIPFFLFTGRADEVLKDSVGEDLEYFPRNELWFHKTIDGTENLCHKIRKEIEYRKTPDYKIKTYYSDVIEAAYLLGNETTDYIYNLLKNDLENRQDFTAIDWTKLRGIYEKIFANCKNNEIIPPIPYDLAGTSKYLLYGKYSIKSNENLIPIFEMKDKNIIPEPLAYSIVYILNVIQDGCHVEGVLKHNTQEYFANNQKSLLFKSLLYTTLEFVKWHKSILEEHPNIEKNKDELWSASNNYGVIEKENGHYHCSNCLLDGVREGDLGKIVYINKKTENIDSNTKDTYPFFAENKHQYITIFR